MTLNLHSILFALAFVCFVLAACGVAARINLLAVGLALWVLANLLGAR